MGKAYSHFTCKQIDPESLHKVTRPARGEGVIYNQHLDPRDLANTATKTMTTFCTLYKQQGNFASSLLAENKMNTFPTDFQMAQIANLFTEKSYKYLH